MYLNGDEVKVGDKLYHLTLQSYGTVETVLHGTARVNMSHRGRGIINMGENGMVAGQKLFYWSKPIIIEPKKHQQALLTTSHEVLINTVDLVQQNLTTIEEEK
ncbi:MAG: hypothetical protein KGV51_01045 [Moraxellaceae bacterium]|nr:hypothetical protein [Moraxellaceae bacterium]